MVKLYEGGAFLVNGTELVPEQETAQVFSLTGKEGDDCLLYSAST